MADDFSNESTLQQRTWPTIAEWVLVALVCCLALWLRFRHFDALAVEHFDEGVYASNIWFGPQDQFQYPSRHLYAPPLLPVMIELLFQQTGPSNAGALWTSLVLGTLTVPLVWWVGRRWFDPVAGLFAALFCATSDLHILLCRSALTDAMLTFWLILSLWLLWEGLARRRTAAAVAAGITTAVTWWTKYNGWLPLAVSFGGLLLWFLWLKKQRLPVQPVAHAWRWLLAAAIALLLWSPCVWSLQAEGGYAAVMANHRNYIVGCQGALAAALEHVRDEAALQSWVAEGSWVGVVVLLVLFSSRRFTWNGARGILSGAFWLTTCLIGVFVLPVALLLAGGWGLMAEILDSGRRPESHDTAKARQLAICFLVVWVIGLLLLTSLYTPYPRLWLPCSSGCWLAAGLALSRVTSATRKRIEVGTGELLAAGLVFSLSLATSMLDDAHRLASDQPRTAMVKLSHGVREAVMKNLNGNADERDGYIVYVYGEPALFFQLRLAGTDLTRPVQDLGFAAPRARLPVLPTYVVIGPHARLGAKFKAELKSALPRLEHLATFHETFSPLVTLDAWGPPEPRQQFELYRCR